MIEALKLIATLSDASPEIRTAALFALGTFTGASGSLDTSNKSGGETGNTYHLGERISFQFEVSGWSWGNSHSEGGCKSHGTKGVSHLTQLPC